MCETYYDSEMDISSVSGRPVLPWPLDVLSLEANTPDHQRKVVSQGVRWARSVAYQSVERVTMPTHPEQDCRHSINIKVPRVYRTLPIAILEHSGRHPPDKCAVLRYLEPAILHVHRHPVASDACEQDLSDCENRWPSAAFKAIVFAPTERHSKVRYNKGIRIHAQHIVVLNSCLPFYWSYRDPIHLARFGFACHAYAELIMQSSHEVMYIVDFDVSNVWQSVLDDALVDVGLPGMRAAGCLGKGNDPREHVFAAIERLDPTRLTELRAKIRFLSLDEYRASKVYDASDEVLIEEAADRE